MVMMMRMLMAKKMMRMVMVKKMGKMVKDFSKRTPIMVMVKKMRLVSHIIAMQYCLSAIGCKFF